MKIHSLLQEARGKDLPLSADLHLLEGICTVLCAFGNRLKSSEEQTQLHGYVSAVMGPMVSTLNQALGLPPPPPHSSSATVSQGRLESGKPSGDGTRDSVIISLERMCLVLRCLRLEPEMYMSLLQHQVLGLLQSLVENRPYSSRLCEKVCRCYKHAIRNASHAFAPLLPALLQHLVLQFSRQHDAGYIYITAIAVGEYCRGCVFDPAPAPGPLLIEAISTITDNFFKRFNTPVAFAQSPDVVEEYFCLLEKTLKVSPALYFSMARSNRHVASLGKTFGEIIYPACISALQTSHRDVHKGALSLFQTLVTTAEGVGSRSRGCDKSEDEARLRVSALHEIKAGLGKELVAAVFRFLASQESKVAIGGETDNLGLLLLSMSRVLYRAARDEGHGTDRNSEMSEWMHHAVAALESMPSHRAASASSGGAGNGSGGGGGGGGGVKPSVAIAKTEVCELILRGDEDPALDALHRFHRNVVGGRD